MARAEGLPHPGVVPLGMLPLQVDVLYILLQEIQLTTSFLCFALVLLVAFFDFQSFCTFAVGAQQFALFFPGQGLERFWRNYVI